jgi:hypothetical protein
MYYSKCLTRFKEEHMKLTIDTEQDDFEDAVRAIFAAYGQPPVDVADHDEPAPPTNGSALLPGGWTEKKLRQWAALLTVDAKEVVRYVAANAPEVSWDDVAAHLGAVKGEVGPVSGAVLGGAMSSGGHARKKIRGAPKDQPLDRDYNQRQYIIDARIAEILSDELGPPRQA